MLASFCKSLHVKISYFDTAFYAHKIPSFIKSHVVVVARFFLIKDMLE